MKIIIYSQVKHETTKNKWDNARNIMTDAKLIWHKNDTIIIYILLRWMLKNYLKFYFEEFF